jgi:hypothetical protein
MSFQTRLVDLGLTLPAPPQMPPGTVTTFSWVPVADTRLLVLGHGPQNPDGSPAALFGRVPDEVSLAQAYASVRLAALPVMASTELAIATWTGSARGSK